MSYPGGKAGAGVYQQIINRMPPHRRYIEAFLGGGAIMRLKRPAAVNIGIDRDREAIAAFPRRKDLTLSTGDALTFLRTWNAQPTDLVYCDPPYVMDARSSRRRLYRYEFSNHQHRALLAVLKRLPCMVMVSGYYSLLYADELEGWTTATFNAMTRGGRLAQEWLWYNYPEPDALHDYRFLGDGFRERERIKRKRERWRLRLQKMPRLERQAILSAFDLMASSDPESGDDTGSEPLIPARRSL